MKAGRFLLIFVLAVVFVLANGCYGGSEDSGNGSYLGENGFEFYEPQGGQCEVPGERLYAPAPVRVYGVEVITPPLYDWVYDFSEGLAAVRLDGSRGFIDTYGNVVVPLLYDQVPLRFRTDGFSEGLAAVNFYGWWGFVDTQGNEVVPLIYERAGDFSEGLAAVTRGWNSGFIDRYGEEVIPLTFHSVRSFSEGLAAAAVGEWAGLGEPDFFEHLEYVVKWGFIDAQGNEVIPFIYDEVRDFSEGLAAVLVDGKWGFIDAQGNKVVPFIYDGVNSFSGGLAAVAFGERDQWGVVAGVWGFIDAQGDEVVTPRYTRVWDFSEGLAAVAAGEWDGMKWGFVDTNGIEVVPPRYGMVFDFSDGLAAVAAGELGEQRWGFVNAQGDEVVPPRYNSAGRFTGGLAAVSLASGPDSLESFFINTAGETFPIEPKFSSHRFLGEGLAAYFYNGAWGVARIITY